MAPVEEVPEIAGSSDSVDGSAALLGRLRADNDLLRERLAAAETVAQEREQRIEDLLSALRGLPGAWVQHLERTIKREPAAEAGPARVWQPNSVVEVRASPSRSDVGLTPVRPEPSPSPPQAASRADLGAAEAAWEEVRLLRDRLELRRLDRELEQLRSRPRGRRFRRQPLPRAG